MKVSIQVYILYEECGHGIAKLQKIFPALPKMTVYSHMKKLIGNIEAHKRKITPGAPRKLKKRNERQIMKSINKPMKDIGTFSSMELQDYAGLASKCSNRTVRHFLNRNDYGYYQCRRKGQLTPEDVDKRLKFCKECK